MTDITRYDPFGRSPMRDLVDQWFGRFPWPTGLAGLTEARGSTTAMVPANLYETPDGFHVVLSLPGADPQQFNVAIQEQVLTVSGTRGFPMPEGAQPLWCGLPEGPFQYAFALPVPVQAERIEAHYEHGLLLLNLPKVEQARSRQIQVQVGTGGAKQLQSKTVGGRPG